MDKVSPITLILSDEELLTARAISEQMSETAEIVAADSTGIDMMLLAGLFSPDLFIQEKIVLLENAQNLKKDALSMIESFKHQFGHDLRLVLSANTKANALAKAASAWGAEIIKISKVSKLRDQMVFARSEVKLHQKRISDDAAKAIIDATGGDLRGMSGMISQLVSQNENPMIEEQAVREFFDSVPETSGFVVADAAVSGRPSEALKTVRQALIAGTPRVLMVTALINTLKDMTAVVASGATSAQSFAASSGMPGWKAEKTFRKTQGWKPHSLAAAYAIALEAETLVKGGSLNVDYALERAVLNIALAKSK